MLRLLLLSDLHAIIGDPGHTGAVSNLTANPSFDNDLNNPVRAVGSVIRDEKLKVDWLICPGDLSDKADPIAQRFAWEQLERLRLNVGATKLIGTAGNHDVDSRLAFSHFDPKGNLQSLAPPFPGLTEIEVDRYWSRNFVVLTEENVCLVVLNSAAFHGFRSIENTPSVIDEYLHGRVSDRTIEGIVQEVGKVKADLHLLLTHHHILPAEDIYQTSTIDMMIGGQTLLKRLTETSGRRWVVLHGHQHFPRIRYLPEKGYPIIFSAGSVSARLAPELVQRAGNQFYHVEFPMDDGPDVGWEGCGRVKAWHWVRGTGWLRTAIGSNAGIPYGSGFGYIGPAAQLAKRLSSLMSQPGRSAISFAEVCILLPEIGFLSPEDFQSFLTACKLQGVRYKTETDARDPGNRNVFLKD